MEEPDEEEGKKERYASASFLPFFLFASSTKKTDLFITICFSVNDALAFDGVDFDEPMEVGLEEEKPALKDDAEPSSKTVAAVKVVPKAEPQDPVLL